MFLTKRATSWLSLSSMQVSIPSNRGSVSDMVAFLLEDFEKTTKSQSPLIGAVFLTDDVCVQNFGEVQCLSQSPLIGAVFLTDGDSNTYDGNDQKVSIPSNRGSVSDTKNVMWHVSLCHSSLNPL
ncbi:hypothetical protein MTBBW1_3320001 [Desulfamplus magnetovallimortis]|uniref:Uncharacterized protein n=1 Tax=Desulfamplus magnetovallimortis TaxID=1246637 RepID=A0A1W1HG04_9BACT|nr:hypothetical protein MTBBW1_3320001 [Desulfamplus magnetovallimortis]